jgi:hypothetical protein
VSDHLAARGINLPCASRLTEDDVDYAAGVVRKLLLGAKQAVVVGSPRRMPRAA